ncbi:CBS domain-containing protein [Bdellovibrio svalbardensis]|uniref:CBS domain-containing protein n=1 Tax=Bdellovibrio svalbardensis TaxID=2972972 RepID=A0ABT6DIH6_9BACT|nr:CBS domain-containing protein [Bdellovibrio svalbardensis]MDG0816324.1 CBS domain-containing protein [Bdellovibrio svalbardensis]
MKPELKNNMTHSLITISKNATAAEAYSVMNSEWIRHLPVIEDTTDYIVGIISDRDLLKAPHSTTPIYSLMSSPVRCFDISTPVRTVVKSMIDNKLSAFLITDKSEVAGIVTSEDMLLLLSQLLKDDHSAKWILSEFLVNPVLQRSIDLAAQAGI